MAKTTIVADFSTTITSKWAIGATTGTITTATDDDGVALPTGRYGFTIDRNNSAKEYITCTLTGTSLTDIKTVSRQGVETSGTIREHRKGAEIVITDFVAINEFVTATGDNAFTGDNTHTGNETFSKSLKIPFYADAAARATAIPSPTDGMLYYQNDVEEFYGYKNGAWQTLGSGGGGSAVWYQDSTSDGTITGAINGVNTSYVLSHTPGSVDAMILTYNGQVMERGATDDYTIVANTITMNTAPVSGKLVAIYPDQGVGTQNATTRSTTGASSVNGELFRKSDDSNSLYYKDNAGDEVKLVDITSNKIPVASVDLTGANFTAGVDAATTSAAGKVELATDAEVETGTDTSRAVTPSQLGKYAVSTNLRDDWYTFNVPIMSTSDTVVPTGWTGSVAGSGDIYGAAYTNLIPSGGAPYAELYTSLPGNGADSKYRFSAGKNIRIKFRARLQGAASADRQGFGICVTTTAIDAAYTDTTTGTVRFIKDGANVLYAHNANGTATNTNISSGLTLTSWNTYEIVYTLGTDIKFYVNGALKATHTTNLPTNAADTFMAFGLANGNGIELMPLTVSIEL